MAEMNSIKSWSRLCEPWTWTGIKKHLEIKQCLIAIKAHTINKTTLDIIT